MERIINLLIRDDADPSAAGTGDEVTEDVCGVVAIDRIGLRIGALFIILVTSLAGTMFPVITRRIPFMRNAVPGFVFEFAKFFGSGVILATAFIHLLSPANDSLGEMNQVANGGCVPDGWGEYPFAFAICLFSLFVTFVIELVAFRIGTARLAKVGISSEGVHHRPQYIEEGNPIISSDTSKDLSPIDAKLKSSSDSSLDEAYTDSSENQPAAAQIIGVAILEFGVMFHSLVIGLTLAVTSSDEFNTLFIVLIFHQMFEGLGLGTRLAFLKLPQRWAWAPFAGGALYSLMTPIGVAIGLGARTSISMTSSQASIASGVLDSISAGILIYTATVELIAHEFIFNKYYHTCSWKKLVFVIISFAVGAGIMALLGKWA